MLRAARRLRGGSNYKRSSLTGIRIPLEIPLNGAMAEEPFNRQEPKGKEPMEIFENVSQQHHVHPHQTQFFPEQSSSISPQGLSYGGDRITLAHIQQVQNLIERCLQLYMDQSQVVTTLHELAKIEPAFIVLIWKKIEEQNTEFFKEYYMRLKLKNQIVEFNHLLEQQVRMMELMHKPPLPTQNAHMEQQARMMELMQRAPLSVQNAHMGHPTPPSGHVEDFGFIPPPHSLLMHGSPIIYENSGTHGPKGMFLGSSSHVHRGPMGMTMGMDGTQNRIGDLLVDVPNLGGTNRTVSLDTLGQSPMGTMTTPTTSMGMDATENRIEDVLMNVPNTGGMSRSVSLEDLGKMTQNFSFPDLVAYFASSGTSQSDSSGQISQSFSFSELTTFASSGASQSESLGLIPKTYSFSELAEVFASDELNNNAGDVNRGLLGSFGDLTILAPEDVLQSPDENEIDEKIVAENIYRFQP